MAKTAYDVALLLDVMIDKETNYPGSTRFVDVLVDSWKDLSVATLDPEEWKFPVGWLRPVKEATEQIVRPLLDQESELILAG